MSVVDLFEVLLGSVIAGIDVGMEPPRQRAEGSLHLLLVGGLDESPVCDTACSSEASLLMPLGRGSVAMHSIGHNTTSADLWRMGVSSRHFVVCGYIRTRPHCCREP